MRNCVSPLCFKGQVKNLSLFVFPKPSPWGADSPCQGEMSRRDRGDRNRCPSAHTGADEGPGFHPLSCRGAHCAPTVFNPNSAVGAGALTRPLAPWRMSPAEAPKGLSSPVQGPFLEARRGGAEGELPRSGQEKPPWGVPLPPFLEILCDSP